MPGLNTFREDVTVTVVWWLSVTEAQKFDAGIRVKRWHRRIDHLADGKRLLNKALGHTKQKLCTAFLARWREYAAGWKKLNDTAKWLWKKRAFIHKWRVEWMGMMAELSHIRDKVREYVDPIAAAKIRGIRHFKRGPKYKAMLKRGDMHWLKTNLIKRWGGFVKEKQALQAKVDSYKQVSDEYKAKMQFWSGMEEVMRRVRAERRAASAFRMKAPRMALNTWRAQLELLHEARRELVMLCAKTGEHLKPLKKMLEAITPSFREAVLCQVDEWMLTPLMWCAKRGHGAVAEVILSYGGRMGNNSNTRDLLTADDTDGATPLHHAARNGASSGVMNAILVLAENIGIERADGESFVDATNVEGSTALHWAARKNNVPAIRMLLDHGADASKRNKWGATPLDNAVGAPHGAFHAVAALSRDANQIKEALQSVALSTSIRETEAEIREREEYLAEVAITRREDDKATLLKLKTARLEGWLGWHPAKMDPEVIMPQRRAQNADIALANAIAASNPDATPGSTFRRSPTSLPLAAVNPEDSGGVATPAAPIDISPSASTPSAYTPASPSSRKRKPWLSYNAIEHAELVRAVEEAQAAGNHKCGVAGYEQRVEEAMRVLRLLKRDGHMPSRTPPKPTPILTKEEQEAKAAAEAAAIDVAVATARMRARSPQTSPRSFREVIEGEAAASPDAPSTSPGAKASPGSASVRTKRTKGKTPSSSKSSRGSSHGVPTGGPSTPESQRSATRKLATTDLSSRGRAEAALQGAPSDRGKKGKSKGKKLDFGTSSRKHGTTKA